jgi:hypothetical protein
MVTIGGKVKYSSALFAIGLTATGAICGTATGRAQPSSTPAEDGEPTLAAESVRLLFEQQSLPWWVRDMRVQGGPSTIAGDLHQVLALNRGRAAIKSLLGDNRWRRLDGTRFALEVDSLGFTRNPEEDRIRKEEMADVLRSNFVKLTREAMIAHLGLDELADRYVERIWPGTADRGDDRDGAGGPRLRISPRLEAGDSADLGLKLRLRGMGSSLWQSAYLKLNRDLGEDSTRALLAFEHPGRDRDLYVEYSSDDPRQGRYVRFSIRFSY